MFNFSIQEGRQSHKIAVYYEHPQWFEKMFAEFDRRGIAYDRLLAYEQQFDPAVRERDYALIINRMSPPAHTCGRAHLIPYTMHYLHYLEDISANVLHGYETYRYEFSKANQLALLSRLGINYPAAQVIHHPSQVAEAAQGLMFPLISKVNIGGSGAGIGQYESIDELEAAANAGNIGSFNLCPADYCLHDGTPGIQGYTPPPEIIETVERITRAANIEVGGVEYLINERDGEPYYYDINAMSNFVADAENVIGFDPFPRPVDFLLERAGIVPEFA